MTLLLICLAISLRVLVAEHPLFSRHPVGEQTAAIPPSSCPTQRDPVLATVTYPQLQHLRGAVEMVARSGQGNGYAWGTVSARAVWNDDGPDSVAGPGRAQGSSRWPGGYEERAWAPDPRFGAAYPDDIGADAFLFPTRRAAEGFFATATSVTCHSEGVARHAAVPLGARGLTWVNPDRAVEDDVFLRSGRVVYRVVVVRPRSSEAAMLPRGLVRAEVLACSLPHARCELGHERREPRRRGNPV